MHHREGRLEAGIHQVGVVALELGCLEQALVDQPPGGEAHDHEVGLAHSLGLGEALDAPPDDVELSLELALVARAALDEELAHHGLARARKRADRARVNRHVAESQRAMALLGADAHAELLAAQPKGRVARQEDEARPVAAGLRQPVAEARLELAPQKPVGELHHDAGAVARVGVCAGRAAMLEAAEGAGGALHQLMRLAAVEPDQRAQTAGGMFESLIVERWQRRTLGAHQTTIAKSKPFGL